MKFNKQYIIPMLALVAGFCSCTNEDESIFDLSAAERLEAGQKAYFDALCADGGKWAMEYFANDEEPGYLFVMTFYSDKSVDIATDHKWIGSTFQTERSLWDVINDDSNVLTFNSFNTLFHCFSDPENITGVDAPTDSNGNDIDEQGYGHNGDYEFLLMENKDGNIRLLGKKRGLYAYLRKLSEETDPEAYLAEAATKRAVFSNKNFPTFVMTESATDAEYDITGISSGVVSIMPHETTNQYAQTESKACIITSKGMRPISAFDGIRIDDTHFSISEFTWADDGTLVTDGFRIKATIPSTNLLRSDLKTWSIVDDSMSEALVEAMEAANEQTPAIASSAVYIQVFGRNPVMKSMGIGYETVGGKIRFALKGSCGNQPVYYYGTLEALENGNVKIELTDLDDPLSMLIIPTAPKVEDFMKLFNGEYTAENIEPMDASAIHMTSVDNPAVSFDLKLK